MNDPHKLIDWSVGTDIIRRCDLIGAGVALLEKVCHWRQGFEVSNAQARPSLSLSLPAICRSRCTTLGSSSSTMFAYASPFFPPWRWWTEPISQPQWNIFFIRVSVVIVSLHSNRSPKTGKFFSFHRCFHWLWTNVDLLLLAFFQSSTRQFLWTVVTVNFLEAQEAWWASIIHSTNDKLPFSAENRECYSLKDTALCEAPSHPVIGLLSTIQELHYSPSPELILNLD